MIHHYNLKFSQASFGTALNAPTPNTVLKKKFKVSKYNKLTFIKKKIDEAGTGACGWVGVKYV